MHPLTLLYTLHYIHIYMSLNSKSPSACKLYQIYVETSSVCDLALLFSLLPSFFKQLGRNNILFFLYLSPTLNNPTPNWCRPKTMSCLSVHHFLQSIYLFLQLNLNSEMIIHVYMHYYTYVL